MATTANTNSQSISNTQSAGVDDQQRLEAYVVDFVSKSLPKNISEEPDIQCKLAVVEKLGTKARYVPYSEFEQYAREGIMQDAVRPTFAKSVEQLRTIVLVEPAKKTLFVIDTTKQAIIAQEPMENYEGKGASTLEAALYISNACYGKTN
jgi:hypothetical protein